MQSFFSLLRQLAAVGFLLQFLLQAVVALCPFIRLFKGLVPAKFHGDELLVQCVDGSGIDAFALYRDRATDVDEYWAAEAVGDDLRRLGSARTSGAGCAEDDKPAEDPDK